MLKWARQWLPTIAIAVVISLFIRTYVAEAMKVPSGSMIPTIQINDHLLVEKLMWFSELDYEDIVVFYPPSDENKYVKRLIGLPGDTIEVRGGELYRNGEIVHEPYINERMTYEFGPVTVPEGNYLFLGDNRNISYDAHLWETPFVAEDQIVGKVLFDIPTHYILN